jgi:hypothetical protein
MQLKDMTIKARVIVTQLGILVGSGVIMGGNGAKKADEFERAVA